MLGLQGRLNLDHHFVAHHFVAHHFGLEVKRPLQNLVTVLQQNRGSQTHLEHIDTVVFEHTSNAASDAAMVEVHRSRIFPQKEHHKCIWKK